MIAAAVGGIAQQLNQSFRRTLGVGEDLVVVSSLTHLDGSQVTEVSNKLAAFVIRIEQDSLAHRPAALQRPGAQRAGLREAPIHLNLLLMFAATFSGPNYTESLKFISHTIGFFQARPVFDRHNTPDLDTRIDRLTVELEDLSIADLSALWGVLNGHYLPSVLYRVRMVAVDSGQLSGQAPYISQTVSDARP